MIFLVEFSVQASRFPTAHTERNHVIISHFVVVAIMWSTFSILTPAASLPFCRPAVVSAATHAVPHGSARAYSPGHSAVAVVALFLGFVLMIPLLNFRLGKESQIGPATLSVHCTVGHRLFTDINHRIFLLNHVYPLKVLFAINLILKFLASCQILNMLEYLFLFLK